MDAQELLQKLTGGGIVQNAVFSELAWPTDEFQSLRFTECLFEKINFLDACLSGASFVRCQFRRCRFAHADLQDAEFEDVEFVDRTEGPSGCHFLISDLRGSKFVRCDLSLCVIERSELHSITMEDCNLRGVRLERVNFSRAYSRKIISTRATFRGCNLELADLADVRLPDGDFSRCRFREADLSGADLTNADLGDADLYQANLMGAKLAGANLRGADISGLDLRELGSFTGLKINPDQALTLLAGAGINVARPTATE